MTQADQLARALEDLLMFTAEQDANQGDPDTDHPSVTAAMQALAAYRAQADAYPPKVAQPLTEEQIAIALTGSRTGHVAETVRQIVRDVEAAHGIKE